MQQQWSEKVNPCVQCMSVSSLLKRVLEITPLALIPAKTLALEVSAHPPLLFHARVSLHAQFAAPGLRSCASVGQDADTCPCPDVCADSGRGNCTGSDCTARLLWRRWRGNGPVDPASTGSDWNKLAWMMKRINRRKLCQVEFYIYWRHCKWNASRC